MQAESFTSTAIISAEKTWVKLGTKQPSDFSMQEDAWGHEAGCTSNLPNIDILAWYIRSQLHVLDGYWLFSGSTRRRGWKANRPHNLSSALEIAVLRVRLPGRLTRQAHCSLTLESVGESFALLLHAKNCSAQGSA